MATNNLRESYDLLGLPTSASEEEVRKAFKQKARECHPDKNPDDPQATEKFQALRQGYEKIISGSSEEPDDEAYFGGFDSFFHFILVREMMKRRMREEMLARMFGGIFETSFEDDSDEDDLFGSFGRPFFHRGPMHQESSARSQNFRSRDQEDSRYGRSTSYERGASAKPQKKETKDRKKNYPRKPSERNRNSDGPKHATRSQSHNSSQQETTFNSYHDGTTKGKYGKEDFNEESRATCGEQRPSTASKQKNKNKGQMTASEWQKGRKSKKNHKKKQTAKFSWSSSPSKSNAYKEEPDWDMESETKVNAGSQRFPQQTPGSSKTQEHYSTQDTDLSCDSTQGQHSTQEADHSCDSEAEKDWEQGDLNRPKSRLKSDQNTHFDKDLTSMEYEAVKVKDTGVLSGKSVYNNSGKEAQTGDKNGAETGTEPAQKCSETVDFTEEGEVKSSSLNSARDDSFSQEEEREHSSGDQIMFDNEVAQQSNLSKEEMPKNHDDKDNICKNKGNSINIQTSKQDEKEKQDNYKPTIQEAIQVNSKQTDDGRQNNVEKGPLLSPSFERMENNLSGATSANNTASIPAPGDSHVQKDEKRNVKPAFVKTAKVQKQGKAESREKHTEQPKQLLSDKTNSKEHKKNRPSSDKINKTGINQTVNTKKHAYKPEPAEPTSSQGVTPTLYRRNAKAPGDEAEPEQSIPQKKVTSLHRGEVCQGGTSTSEVNKHDSFSEKYTTGKAKSQFDEDLKKKSSLHELPSDSKETQKNGNTSNRKEQGLKEQDTTELLTEKSYDTSTVPSCNNTTENDNMASGCSSDKTPMNQELGFEQAEAIAYRKAPLDADEVTRRRPSKNKKRQERRQRRVEEMLSEYQWTGI